MKYSLMNKMIHYFPIFLSTIFTFTMLGCDGWVNCCHYFYNYQNDDPEMYTICEIDHRFVSVPTGAASDKDTCNASDTKETSEKIAQRIRACCDPMFNENDSSLNHLNYLVDTDLSYSGNFSRPLAIHSAGDLCVRYIMNDYECQTERFEEEYNKSVKDCEADVADIQDEKQRNDLLEGCLFSKFNITHNYSYTD